MEKIISHIRKHLKDTKEIYLRLPQLIASDHNIEESKIKEYAGRQLFELIQNADDAAVSAKEKHMLISIDDERLIVANNGEPFTEEGYDSLFYSHLSSKINEDLIGHKGLGFRALLSWSDEITIYSGGVTVRFSEEIVRSFWDMIKTQEGVQDRVLRSTKKGSNECPIATLKIPEIITGPMPELPNYDTVIVFSLKTDVFSEIEEQLEEIARPDSLLFFNNLTQIKILNHGSETIIARKREVTPTGIKSTVSIREPGSEESIEQNWHLLEYQWETKEQEDSENKGLIINERVEKDHIIIAYSDELSTHTNYLYSYYPTNELFTAPFIVHASFDLTPDRKSLMESKTNKRIFEELASFLCRSAEKFTSDGQGGPDFALKFIGIDKNGCDSIIKRMGFFEALQRHLSSCKIIPTVNDEFISFDDEPVNLPDPIWAYFSGQDVKNLVNGKYIESYEMLRQLAGSTGYLYTCGWFCHLIHEYAQQLPAGHLADLYLYFAEKYKDDLDDLSEYDPILLNREGGFIDHDKIVFFSLGNKIIYDIPHDLAIDFLDEGVSQELEERDKLEKMENAFGIHQYSFKDIANILINHYDEKDNVEDIKEMHGALFQAYKVAIASKEDTGSVETENVRLVSKNGSIVNANKVYFGEKYDNSLTEAIYRNLPYKILGEPEMQGLPCDNKDVLLQYLKWLGVGNLPRKFQVNEVRDYYDFINHVMFNFDYKNERSWGEKYKSYYDLVKGGRLKSDQHEYNFTTVDELDAILKDITIETLMKWMQADETLKRMIVEDNDPKGSLDLHISRRKYLIPIEKRYLKSYIRWKIAQSPLLFDSEDPGKKVAPNRCCLAKPGLIQYFYPSIVRPDVDVSGLAKGLHVTEEEVINLLLCIGVHESSKTFSTRVLYETLLKLPKRDPEGEKAKAIYHEILGYNDDLLDGEDEAYKRFMRDGKVFCRIGPVTGYVNVEEASYIDDNRYGKEIQSNVKVFDLDIKGRNRKVFKLFGVKKLEGIDVKLLDSTGSDHPLNDELQAFLQEVKPYIYTMVRSPSNKKTCFESLMDTKIFIAGRVKAEMRYADEVSEINLAPGEYLHVTKDSSYYICVDETMQDFGLLKRDYVFNNTLSHILASITGSDSDLMYHILSVDKDDWDTVLKSKVGDDYDMELRDTIEAIEKHNSRHISDHIKFWQLLSSCVVDTSDDVSITNEDELNSYLEMMFPDAAQESWIREPATYSNLYNQEIRRKIYEIIKSVRIDYERLARDYHYLDFSRMIRKDLIETRKKNFLSFKASLYNALKDGYPEAKATYFDECERYRDLFNGDTDIPKYVYGIEDYFMKKVEEQFEIELGADKKPEIIDIDEKLKANKVFWEEEIGIPLSDELLRDNNRVKSLLLFAAYDAFTEEVAELDSRVAERIADRKAEAAESEMEKQSTGPDITITHHTTSAVEPVQPQGESGEMAGQVAAAKDKESDYEGSSTTLQQPYKQHRPTGHPATSGKVAGRTQYGVKERAASVHEGSQRRSDNIDRTAADENGRSIVIAEKTLYFDHISEINSELDELKPSWDNTFKPRMIAEQSQSSSGTSDEPSTGTGVESSNIYGDHSTPDVGYAAEYLVYQALVKQYGRGSVEWLSENAKKAGINEQGSTKYGYDIGIMVDGVYRYVEVKAVASLSVGFEITKNELKVARENAGSYDIIIVKSIREDPQFIYLENFFDLPEGEDLENNTSFKFELSSARIRFDLENE